MTLSPAVVGREFGTIPRRVCVHLSPAEERGEGAHFRRRDKLDLIML